MISSAAGAPRLCAVREPSNQQIIKQYCYRSGIYIEGSIWAFRRQHCSIIYLASENAFAGHWETVLDCMENIEKMLAMINFNKELPQNTTVVQTEHTGQYSKVPMTAPSRGSLCMISAVGNNII